MIHHKTSLVGVNKKEGGFSFIIVNCDRKLERKARKRDDVEKAIINLLIIIIE